MYRLYVYMHVWNDYMESSCLLRISFTVVYRYIDYVVMCFLFRDVGKNLVVPGGAKVIDAQKKLVMPGNYK